jgi:predicted nucleic acid-binding protein
MAANPSHFHPINVTDTCSVWNVLSSNTLYDAARKAGCSFCVTAFVRYELLDKPRKSIQATEAELRRRLRQEQAAGRFETHVCTIDDLQAMGNLTDRKALGKGELSSIAFALKIGQGFLSDDKKAFNLAVDRGVAASQTVPDLLAWLVFTGGLSDLEAIGSIDEHKAMDRTISAQLEDARVRSLAYLLNQTQTAPTAVSLTASNASAPLSSAATKPNP